MPLFSYVYYRPSLTISICQELPGGGNEIRAKVSIMQILQLHLKDTFRILGPQFCKKCEALLALGGFSLEEYMLMLGICFGLAKRGQHC